MALLAASTSTTQTSTESSMSIRPQSELVYRYDLEFGPELRYTNALSSALFVTAQQLFQINRVAFTYLLFGCNVAALHTYLGTKELATMSVTALSKIAWGAWNSKQCRRLRKKLEFEFFVLILGSGNGIILMMFWPGWILVGLAYFVYLLWSWAG